MRVGLDFRSTQKANSRRRGIGRYTLELGAALLGSPAEFSFVLYTIGEKPNAPWETRSIFYLPKPSRLNWMLERFLLPRAIRKDRLDLFHAMEITAIPARVDCPVVVTIHDMIPFVFWQETSRTMPLDFQIALRRGLRLVESADRVITDSHHSKNDICRLSGIAEDRVSVVYLGSNLIPSEGNPAEIRHRASRLLDWDGPFLLYVGGSDFRKNLHRLLESFARIRREGYPGRLVLVGETFESGIPEVESIRRLAGQMGLSESLVMLGYLEDPDLAILYGTCDFLFFPSLYEGFGLPVLEAMKCGTPLLISRCSSLPEVAGESAFYFDPEDPDDMASVFWEAFESPRRIEELTSLARERAAMFTWENTARLVLESYRQACGGLLQPETGDQCTG